MATPTAIVAYLGLFIAVAGLFLLVNLLIGRLLRPKLPNKEKLEVYECGEPVIGSSFVQFDLRFYVVALLFIIFDVEIAFFFPWATVFGKSVQLSTEQIPAAVASADADPMATAAAVRLRELGVPDPSTQVAQPGESLSDSAVALQETAHRLALTSFADIGVFFAVLLVGFAYVWRRGDLDWVRATSSQSGEVMQRAPPTQAGNQPRPTGSILTA